MESQLDIAFGRLADFAYKEWKMKRDAFEAKMTRWIESHGNSAIVKAWLKENPPPDNWAGTPQEYAYTEMPFAVIKFFS